MTRITAHQARLTRRSLLAAAGALSSAGLLAACDSSNSSGQSSATPTATGQLTIFSWADYFAQKNLDAFKQKTGINPKIATYSDNDTLFAKLNSAARSSYDVVVPSSGWIKVYSDKGLIQKLDKSRVDLSGLDSSLLDRTYDPGNTYSVPKDWGVFGVIYNPEVTGEIRTWQDFLDAGAKDGVSGKIRLGTSGPETVGIQLWADGIDWNAADESVIRAAGNKLQTWVNKAKPRFTSFDVDQVVNGSIVLAVYNQAGARTAIMQNPKLKWVVPGPTSELWVDSYVIPTGAHNLVSAYDFISFQLTEQAQINDTVYLGYPTALKNLRTKLPKDTKELDLIFGGKGLDLTKLTTLVVNPETLPVYQDVQSQLQAQS